MPASNRFRYLEALPPPAERARGTLVLLHGFPLSARMWEPQLALAQLGWRVIAPQFRGFDGGAADAPGGAIDDYAGDIIDLLDTLQLEDIVLGGLSMGGYVAFALLRHAPSYVRALILADTKSQNDPPEGVEARKRMLQVLVEKGVPAIADEMIPKLLGATTLAQNPELVERVRGWILDNPPAAVDSAVRAMMTRPDSTPMLAGIRVPTLILVGEEDTLTPPALSEGMHREIAGSTLVSIARAGHLSNLEQTSAFNDALAQFLTHRV